MCVSAKFTFNILSVHIRLYSFYLLNFSAMSICIMHIRLNNFIAKSDYLKLEIHFIFLDLNLIKYLCL